MSNSIITLPVDSRYITTKETTNTTSVRMSAATIRKTLAEAGFKGKALKAEVTKVLRSENQANSMAVAAFVAREGVVISKVEMKQNKKTGARTCIVEYGEVVTREESLEQQNARLAELGVKFAKGTVTRAEVDEFNRLTGSELPYPAHLRVDEEEEEETDELPDLE